MKVLIRDKTRKLYLAPGDKWVSEVENGRDFQTGIAAVAHARALRSADVDLFHVFPNAQYNFGIPFEAYDASPDGAT
jgi:hypothetical protein